MIITEYKELESAANMTPHKRRVLYAALDIAVYTDADFDIVIAACLLHESKNAAEILLRHEWDQEKVMAVQKCIDVLAGENVADTSEAKVVADAHRYDDCGALGEIQDILNLESIEKYLGQPFNKSVYNGFLTNHGRKLAKERRQAGETVYNLLQSEIDTVDKRGKDMLKEMLEAEPMYNKLLLIPKDSGFKMDGYFVWCGSVIYASGEYHMFASRWRENLKFPDGYMIGSEIVHATAPNPEGPFVYKKTILSTRQRGCWDAQMSHNPQIVKVGSTYVLYYIGSSTSDMKNRRIGYAVTRNLNDRWERQNHCIDLGREDCNNPAAYVNKDGSILLAFRWGNQRIGVARADKYDGKYTVLNQNILPDIIAEDPFLYMNGNHYEMIVEDGKGALTGHERYGAILESTDGVDWKVKKHCLAYDHTLIFSDLSIIKAVRRERPQLLFNKEGKPTHLYTGVLYDGKTWNLCQPINPN